MISRKQFIENQRDYCHKIYQEFVLPEDGYCPFCGRDIVSYLIRLGMDGTETRISWCPKCYRLFKINKKRRSLK